MLADAGPHPNPSKAAIGQRLHTLAPHPLASPVVQLFNEFLNGAGLLAIAKQLTGGGLLSASGHDPVRNSHRVSSKGAWAKSTVRAILANPRYTGRQVWNRQRKDEILIDVDDIGLGHETRMRWNDASDWVWSQDRAHEPLVSVENFQAAQAMFASAKRAARRTPAEGRNYQLAGLMRCGRCGRRMQGQWNHGKAYYRCEFTAAYPVKPVALPAHTKSVYVKEEAVVSGLNRFLNEKLNEDLDRTVDVLAGHHEVDP